MDFLQDVSVSRSVMSDSWKSIDCSPPSSSVHGILQARILECVVIPFFSSLPLAAPGKPKALYVCLAAQLCPTPCDPVDYSLPDSSVHGDSSGKNTGWGCHAHLQRIFPNQGSNPGLPQLILYHQSHQGSPRILEWVAYPFSRGSS